MRFLQAPDIDDHPVLFVLWSFLVGLLVWVGMLALVGVGYLIGRYT